METIKQVRELKETLLECATILEEVEVLATKEEAGEEISDKDVENLMGRFLLKIVQISSLGKL